MDPHKLDDLFKGKLEHPGTPPFNEVHWKEARGMLQRRNINSRWLLGLFLLALVSSGLYFMVSNVKDAATVGTTERPLAASGPINGEITIWSDDSDHESRDENVELAVKENDLARKAKPSHDGVNMTLPEDSYEVAPDETAENRLLDFHLDVKIEKKLRGTATSQISSDAEVNGLAEMGKLNSPYDPSASTAELAKMQQKIPLLASKPSTYMTAETNTIETHLTMSGQSRQRDFERVG